MKEKQEAKFPSEDIYCMLEPGSRWILGFGVANRDESLVTFLKNGRTYDMNEVQFQTIMLGAIKRASAPRTIYKLVDIYDERKFLSSEIYSPSQLQQIVKMITPYVQYKNQNFTIDEWLALENEFKNYQKKSLLGSDYSDDNNIGCSRCKERLNKVIEKRELGKLNARAKLGVKEEIRKEDRATRIRKADKATRIAEMRCDIESKGFGKALKERADEVVRTRGLEYFNRVKMDIWNEMQEAFIELKKEEVCVETIKVGSEKIHESKRSSNINPTKIASARLKARRELEQARKKIQRKREEEKGI